eukprot:356197-Chlamydomonas_euryale.AAC.4
MAGSTAPKAATRALPFSLDSRLPFRQARPASVTRPPHLVELQHAQLDLLLLVLLLLRLGVRLLLALLRATQQTAQDVQGRLLLHAGKGQECLILQQLAVEANSGGVEAHACTRNTDVSVREQDPMPCKRARSASGVCKWTSSHTPLQKKIRTKSVDQARLYAESAGSVSHGDATTHPRAPGWRPSHRRRKRRYPPQ